MNKSVAPRKVFIKADNIVRINCPACSFSKHITLDQFKTRHHQLKIRCKCGHIFKIELEFRKHPRRATELDGIYKILGPEKNGWQASIVNLSEGGACLELRGRHSVRVGDRGALTFTLDNTKNTVITKEAIVKSVDGNRIGCQFIQDRAYSKELGYYLRA